MTILTYGTFVLQKTLHSLPPIQYILIDKLVFPFGFKGDTTMHHLQEISVGCIILCLLPPYVGIAEIYLSETTKRPLEWTLK